MTEVESGLSIPAHWSRVKLGQLIEKKTDKVEPSSVEDLPYLGLKHIAQGTGKLAGKGNAEEVSSTKNLFEEGDVLYGKLRPYLNKVWQASFDGICSTDILVFRTADQLIPAFLHYRLLCSDFVAYADQNSSGVNHPRVGFKEVSEYPIGLPPLSEQRRIVAKIEELFSNLDAGRSDLQTAGQQLERYRLSVLQAAVEGRLTADWRRTHDSEPADRLLEQVLKEHRKQWEAEYRYRRYDAKDKEPPSGWKSRYTPPEHLEDEADLFSIPEDWEWVRAEQICGFITKGTTPKSDKRYSGEGDIPFVKVYNLTETGELDFTVDPTFVDCETHRGKLARSRLLPGDVVMNIVGPPLGQVSVVPDDYPEWNMNQAVVRYRPLDGVDRQYLTYALRAKSILNWAIRKRKATAGQFNLTLAICRDLPIPLPPLAEQKQIVDEVERLLSVADDTADTAKREETRAKRLRQSILKQAFSGRLVPHDENASPPSIDGTASEPSGSEAAGGTDSDIEDLLGSTDPSKQIEMDL